MIEVLWRIADGKWIVDRPATQIDLLPPPRVPSGRARVQRERITRTDIEAFGTTAGCSGCHAIESGQRAQARSDLCRVRIEECLKTTPEDSERLDRRSEVLNEALAKEDDRNVRSVGNRMYSRRSGSTTGVERNADATWLRPDKETCLEGSDSNCEQWQITDGRQPCSCRDADTAKFNRRVKSGCRGKERETNPEVRKHRTPDDE